MFDFNLTLFRDSLSTPWGFRLEGGREYGAPLSIQRVFAGSPASADLQRGDQILAIQNREASFLSHQEANDIIRGAGGSLMLSIRRGGSYGGGSPSYSSHRPQSSLGFTSPISSFHNRSGAFQYYAEDPINNYVRSRPIEKTKDPKPILSQTGSPIMPGGSPSMSSHSSIKRYRPASTMPILPSSPGYNRLPTTFFAAPQQPLSINTNTNTTATPFDKHMVNQIHSSLNRAVSTRTNFNPFGVSSSSYGYNPVSAAPAYATPHVNRRQPPPPPVQVSSYSQPYDQSGSSWQGNLRRTGIDLYDMQDQQQHQAYASSKPAISPNSSSGTTTFHVGSFSKLSPNHSASSPKSPKIVNLQYNSPIGLYSNKNIKEELHKQIGVQDVQYVPSSEF